MLAHEPHQVNIMYIGQILDLKGRKVITLSPQATVSEAAELLATHNAGITVITGEDGAIQGVISERDIARGVVRFGSELLAMLVKDVMTTNVVMCPKETSVSDILLLMTTHEIRHIPILDDDGLAGVISMRDVVDCRLGELESENESLRQLLTDAA